MEQYLTGAAFVLLAVIVGLVLGKQSHELGLLLSLAACCAVAMLVLDRLEPVVAFVNKLSSISGMDSQMLSILLKTVGIGLIGELAGLICTDAGNASLGKVMQMLTGATILSMSLPLFEKLLDILTNILGEV